MDARLIRLAGAASACLYAALIVWVYVNQPRTMAQVTGGVASTVGAYRVDQPSFGEGLRSFREDRFPDARAAFERADTAQQDPRTQFYVAYSYYRQGFGRVYNDDALFGQGLIAVDKAIALAPGGRLVVDDPDLQLHSADELRVELQHGVTREASDFNPLKIFRTRK